MHRSSLYLQLVFNLKMWFIIHKHGEVFYTFVYSLYYPFLGKTSSQVDGAWGIDR